MKSFIMMQCCIVALSLAVFGADTVHIYDGNSIKDTAAAYPEGTIFFIHKGTYREIDGIEKKAHQQFIGELADDGTRLATISGAVKLENWEKRGDYWVHLNCPVSKSNHGICHRGFKRACAYPQNLYYNSLFLREAETLDHLDTLVFDRLVYPHIGPYEQQADNQWLDPGTWYFDLDSGIVYTLEDPNGEMVDSIELSIGHTSFRGSNDGILIKNLIVEKFANVCQGAALMMSSPWATREEFADSSLWKDYKGGIIENCEVRFNHGIGISVKGASDFRITNCHIHHNGELGIKLQTTFGTVVEGCEVAYNDLYRTIGAWFGEEGGIKIIPKDFSPVIRKNYIHHNWGKGLWCDAFIRDALFEGNLVEHNGEIGIFLEIMDSLSTENIARYNIVRRNGQCSWFYGSQIVISSAPKCNVYKNVVLLDETHDANLMTVMWQIDDGYRGALGINGSRYHNNDVTVYNPSQQPGRETNTGICEDRPEAEWLGGLDMKYGFGMSTKGSNKKSYEERLVDFAKHKAAANCDTCLKFYENHFHFTEGYTRKSFWWPGKNGPDTDGDSLSDDQFGNRYTFEEYQALGKEQGSTMDNLVDTSAAYAIQTLRDSLKAPLDIVKKLAEFIGVPWDVSVRPRGKVLSAGAALAKIGDIRFAQGVMKVFVSASSNYEISIFNARGRRVARKNVEIGTKTGIRPVSFNIDGNSTGLYLVTISDKSKAALTRKTLFVR